MPAVKHIAMLRLGGDALAGISPVDALVQVPDMPPFGTVLALATNAPTLDQAFRCYLHYRVLIGDVDDMTMRRAGDEYDFDYVLDGAQPHGASAVGNLALMARLARQYIGGTMRHAALELVGPAFAPLGQVQSALGCHVRFGQARNRLRLVAPSASAPYERHNAVSNAILSRQADGELARLRRSASFAARVEDHLLSSLRETAAAGAGVAPMDDLCRRLALSRSAVLRRLQKEDTSVQRLLANVRLAEAKRLLDDRQLSISDISDQLGFSSPAAFSRFFSEQLGIAPSRYQRAHRVL